MIDIDDQERKAVEVTILSIVEKRGLYPMENNVNVQESMEDIFSVVSDHIDLLNKIYTGDEVQNNG